MIQQCLPVYLSETCLFVNPLTTGDFSSCTMCWSKQLSHEMQNFSHSVMNGKVNSEVVVVSMLAAGLLLLYWTFAGCSFLYDKPLDHLDTVLFEMPTIRWEGTLIGCLVQMIYSYGS